MHALQVSPEECLYIGDGGSYELETASELGMNTAQAVWYFKEEIENQSKRMASFSKVERPLDILNMLSLYTKEE